MLVGIAGLTFQVEAGGGLYWLIPAAVASLAGRVVNAWLFLVRQPASPNAPGSQSKPARASVAGRCLGRQVARSLLKKAAGPGVFAGFAFDELG